VPPEALAPPMPKEPQTDEETDIRFACPQCSQHLVIERAGAGCLITCPHCGCSLHVPRPSPQPENHWATGPASDSGPLSNEHRPSPPPLPSGGQPAEIPPANPEIYSIAPRSFGSRILGENPEELGIRIDPTARRILDYVFAAAEKFDSIPRDLFQRVMTEARDYWSRTGASAQETEVAEGIIYKFTLDRVLADEDINEHEMMLVEMMLRCIEVRREVLAIFRAKLAWIGWAFNLSHGRLPVADDPPLRLQPSELCHVVVPVAKLFEYTTSHRQFSGNSVSVGFKVAKGMTIRFGQFRGHSAPIAAIRPVEDVKVCVTNQRLYYTGNRSSEAIALSAILNIECFEDGVAVYRQGRSKKTVLLKMEEGDAHRVYGTIEKLQTDGAAPCPSRKIKVPQDNTETAKWYRKAADQGDADAQYKLGLLYDNGQGVPLDYAEAAKWYRKAADQENADAQFKLGLLYDNGQGVPQDYAEAAKWYRKAADQENACGQYLLGILYDVGHDEVPQNYAEAAKWYRKAADQENACGQYLLGLLYANGQGVPQDYAEAAMWYRKAADQGNVEAQKLLGTSYADGEGVPQDYAEAAKWYRKAADQGNVEAQKLLGKLRPKRGGPSARAKPKRGIQTP
jgi:hypothetical protein